MITQHPFIRTIWSADVISLYVYRGDIPIPLHAEPLVVWSTENSVLTMAVATLLAWDLSTAADPYVSLARFVVVISGDTSCAPNISISREATHPLSPQFANTGCHFTIVSEIYFAFLYPTSRSQFTNGYIPIYSSSDHPSILFATHVASPGVISNFIKLPCHSNSTSAMMSTFTVGFFLSCAKSASLPPPPLTTLYFLLVVPPLTPSPFPF